MTLAIKEGRPYESKLLNWRAGHQHGCLVYEALKLNSVRFMPYPGFEPRSPTWIFKISPSFQQYGTWKRKLFRTVLISSIDLILAPCWFVLNYDYEVAVEQNRWLLSSAGFQYMSTLQRSSLLQLCFRKHTCATARQLPAESASFNVRVSQLRSMSAHVHEKAVYRSWTNMPIFTLVSLAQVLNMRGISLSCVFMTNWILPQHCILFKWPVRDLPCNIYNRSEIVTLQMIVSNTAMCGWCLAILLSHVHD